jgi:malonyl CoA-acyl carrier protein transacylase
MFMLMFPGAYSREPGTEVALLDEVGEYATLEPEVDRALGYSMRRLLLESRSEKLAQAQYSQPATYVINALHYFKLKSAAAWPRASFVAGYGLGEYNALLAAGVFDFVTGLKLVQRRGTLMASVRNGGMAQVVGVEGSTVGRRLRGLRLFSLDVASFDSLRDTTVSGPGEDIDDAVELFAGGGNGACRRLEADLPLHSRYMMPAAEQFREFLGLFSFSAPSIPVVANASGKLYPARKSRRAVRSLLVQQFVQPVLWLQTVQYVTGCGVTRFIECGSGRHLTRLVRRILR